MNRYTQVFNRLANHNKAAFVPFVVLGDPDFATSLEIIELLVNNGADALELGIPFSDPLADGPDIQNATLRAFNSGMTVARAFEMLTIIRSRHPELPIGLLMYANIVFSQGIEQFYQQCALAGVDSVLIADVPMREYAPFYQAATAHKIAPIFICPPDADEGLINDIAQQGQGYIYLVSRSGVTGGSAQKNAALASIVTRLKSAGAPPILQGFGIAHAQDAHQALTSGIHGVIVGSAIARIIAANGETPDALVAALEALTQSIHHACLE